MRSIGARKQDILAQFIIESIVLTLIAGGIWVIIGSIILGIFNLFSPYQIVWASSGIILSIVFSVATWVFFGIYPARKASELDPVDALR